MKFESHLLCIEFSGVCITEDLTAILAALALHHPH